MQAIRTVQGHFPMETTYHRTAVDGTLTKMTLQNKGNPKEFSKLFATFMSTIMRQANKKDLINIKETQENK